MYLARATKTLSLTTAFVYQCLAINTFILLGCSFKLRWQYLRFPFCEDLSLWNDISFKLRFKSRFFPKEDPSCYLGEGVAVIYSLHTTGARLTRCVSEWLSLGSWQLLPPLLKRQSTLCFSFPPKLKGEVITCPETFFPLCLRTFSGFLCY